MATIVTAYYAFASKHSPEDYMKWMHNFLGNVATPIIMFTSSDLQYTLQNMRGVLPIHIVALPISHWETSKYDSYWEQDKQRDPELYHTANLYKVWNEKPFFVERAMKLNPYGSSYFVWVDAGCFRTSNAQILGQMQGFPKIEKLETLPKHRMTLLQMGDFTHQDYELCRIAMLPKQFKSTDIRIGGTILCSDTFGWIRYITLYRGILASYMKANYFTGKDQNLMATLVIMYPDVFHLVSCKPAKYDPWFYLQEYLCGI